MSQIRLYLDEDAQRGSLVIALRNSNVDVTTVSEVGRIGSPDDQQLMWATQHGRVLYSFNVKDFSRLHNRLLTEEKTHAGIIVVPRQRYSDGERDFRRANLRGKSFEGQNLSGVDFTEADFRGTNVAKKKAG